MSEITKPFKSEQAFMSHYNPMMDNWVGTDMRQKRIEWGYRMGHIQSKPITSNKINRNAPCPCGSGKKYKKCCIINP